MYRKTKQERRIGNDVTRKRNGIVLRHKEKQREPTKEMYAKMTQGKEINRKGK